MRNSCGRASRALLDYNRDEDLQRMYALLSRISEGLEPLRKKFEEHVKKARRTALSKLVGEGTEGADGLVLKAYVMRCRMCTSRTETVFRRLKGDAGFVTSLDKAYEPKPLLVPRPPSCLRKTNKEDRDILGRVVGLPTHVYALLMR